MICPNCGRPFEGDRCPQCGRPAKTHHGRTTAILLIVLTVVPCGVFGACTALIGSGSTRGLGDPFALLGLASLAVGLGILVLAVKQWRK